MSLPTMSSNDPGSGSSDAPVFPTPSPPRTQTVHEVYGMLAEEIRISQGLRVALEEAIQQREALRAENARLQAQQAQLEAELAALQARIERDNQQQDDRSCHTLRLLKWY